MTGYSRIVKECFWDLNISEDDIKFCIIVLVITCLWSIVQLWRLKKGNQQ